MKTLKFLLACLILTGCNSLPKYEDLGRVRSCKYFDSQGHHIEKFHMESGREVWAGMDGITHPMFAKLVICNNYEDYLVLRSRFPNKIVLRHVNVAVPPITEWHTCQ